jgi:hypothetical protein
VLSSTWDSWVNPVGLSTGAYWLTFLKHIDSNNNEKYWIRLDSNRRDSVSQFGKIYAESNEYSFELVDNPPGLYYRAGVGGRTTPAICTLHAFYNLTPEMIDSIGRAVGEVKITLDFQNRKDLPFPISETNRAEFRKLLTLSKKDYSNYARKP